jgi:hypothetical protein
MWRQEVSRVLKVRTKIVPVIFGALGTIKKRSDQNLQLLPWHPSATQLQKITQISTAKCWGKSLLSLVEILTY